jgi:SAM-dependent methyltransferase
VSDEPELEATGERLIPEAAVGELVLAEHLARYRLATRLARGRRVLDAACGEGYGTAMLAAAGASAAVGVDIDPATVRHAAAGHGIDARVADVAALPFDDGSFDLVVSFETIEHVLEPHNVLDELRRVLAPGGLLLISTPNAREYKVENEFHVRELDPDEFVAALQARFAAVRVLYQQNFLLSMVVDEQRLAQDDPAQPVSLDVTKAYGVPPGRELYTLALCGLEPDLPTLEADVAVVTGVYEAHELAARTVEAERLVVTWHERATEAERIQREWQARATEAERQNEELRTTIERIRASISWRITKPLRSLRCR